MKSDTVKLQKESCENDFNKSRRTTKAIEILRAWLTLSRLPFHSVGLLPFILGGILAHELENVFRWDVFFWGGAGVELIMFTTYYAGEYWDYVEDSFSVRLGTSRFAGGSGVLQDGVLSRHYALWASLICLILSIVVGLILQFIYQTGRWTFSLCILGILGGFFYSTQPLRWVRTGLGELWIAFCYGWLPVATGYYLQTSNIAPIVHWISVPIGLTIFNVILLNEFPDYSADYVTGKTNLLVRLGRKRASYLYGFTSFVSWGAVLISIIYGVPIRILWIYPIIMLISLTLAVLVIGELWQNRIKLEKLCAINLVVNLGTTAAYIFAFVS